MAQSFTIRECYESEIPSAKRSEYYKEAHRIIENHYMLLLESVGDAENRDVIIEQMISDKRTVALKTEFLLTQDNNLSFCNPQQYYTRFEYIYKDLVDKVNFKVDNFKDGKIMMNSLISCFIPVEYDLALMEGDKMLFKRRCRMHCLFPRATASKLVKVMQVEPVRDIVSYKTVITNKSDSQITGTPDEWYRKGYDFYKNKYYTQAVEWYTKAANQNNTAAQCNLGYCYDVGQGVKQSYEKAVEWYTKAANQGYATAQCNLGYCYKNGQGVPQSYEKAVEWYTKAAEQGHATAQCNLGNCYKNGQGVPQSYEKAVEWYTKAANQGYAKAQFNLSKLLFKGKGLQKSYLKSVGYFFKAAYNGYEGAVAVLVVIFLVAFFAIIIFINRKDLF